MSSILSFRETTQLAREYLEVAFHLVLYLREVYPAGLFRQVKKYETPTWQARASALVEYIGRIMECVEEELSKGTVKRVVLVLRENSINQTPFERYVFDFEWLIKNEDFPKDGGDFVPQAGGANRGDVEDWFKGCLRRLNASASFLKRLPGDVEFTTVLEMKSNSPPPQSKAAQRGDYPCEWIPAETRQTSEKKSEQELQGKSTISSVDAVRLGMLSMDIRVEETQEKFSYSTSSDFDSSGEVLVPRGGIDRKGKGKAL
ncbi:hypothetical protein JCM3765_005698 [Sporobolomyces pararoseus]